MLVFGEKAIPKDLLRSGKYKPHCVIIGEDTHWGPLEVDIKPMFYVFHDDMSDTNIPIEDWIEQCLSRLALSLREFAEIDCPHELCDVMHTVELALFEVLWGGSKIIEI